jgi:hypothetical protein
MLFTKKEDQITKLAQKNLGKEEEWGVGYNKNTRPLSQWG